MAKPTSVSALNTRTHTHIPLLTLQNFPQQQHQHNTAHFFLPLPAQQGLTGSSSLGAMKFW